MEIYVACPQCYYYSEALLTQTWPNNNGDNFYGVVTWLYSYEGASQATNRWDKL